jgi:exonuclease III
MTNEEIVKEKLYADLGNILRKTPKEDKLILLGDFNARVGRAQLVNMGSENATQMVSLLLARCKEHELVVTNTMFQLPLAKISTWMHPRLNTGT